MEDDRRNSDPEPEGYRLTTAEILYHRPDDPDQIQTFLWRGYDRIPEFPRLRQFLDFWDRMIDSQLYSVTVTEAGEMQPPEFVVCEDRYTRH